MLTRAFSLLILGFGLVSVVTADPADPAEPSMDDLMKKAVLDYTGRVQVASEELAETRNTIADERAPLMDDLRSIEDRVLLLEAEVRALETESSRIEQNQTEAETSWNSAVENMDYLSRVALQSLEGMKAALLPGETDLFGERIDILLQVLSDPSRIDRTVGALEVPDLQLDRLLRQIGGYRTEGMAVSEGDGLVRDGTFAFVGPETFFASNDLAVVGPVRHREGSPVPTVFDQPEWIREDARGLFAGEPGGLLMDASGGKALPFTQSKDTLIRHLRKGGIVGFVIIGLGTFAFVAGLVKVVDLRRLSLDSPSVVQGALNAVASRPMERAEEAVAGLRATTRDLFETGMRNIGKPKAILEEHLSAFILRQRIDHERRLPLLAVIAAAAPLLGLLGTVVGMVKTFTLITIYGTGNAGRLSSGISEALVTTELGLIVAIPTLVLHGYLTQRTQKNLSLLEQYAVEFVTAAEERRSNPEERA